MQVRDPSVLAGGIEVQSEISKNLSGKSLVGPIPTVLLRVQNGLPVRDPSDITTFNDRKLTSSGDALFAESNFWMSRMSCASR